MTATSSRAGRRPIAPVRRGDVVGVMVGGRWLLRDGLVLTLDEPALLAGADQVARRAWRRLFEERPDLTPPPGLRSP